MHAMSGGCHCGNIRVELQLPNPPGAYSPRACDCSFCRKHGAAYVSDPNGSLLVRVRDAQDRGSYRQGSGQAEFVLCRNCGVLVAVLLRNEGRVHGAVNANSLADTDAFGTAQPVSPQKLSPTAKVQRWQDVWFSNILIVEPPVHRGPLLDP
jgi:hypothetical protein